MNAAQRTLEALDAKLATARRRLADAPDGLLEEYQRLVLELKEEHGDAEAELASLRAGQPVAEEGDQALLTRWLQTCRHVCAADDTADGEELNAVLRELITEVVVWPARGAARGKPTVGKIEVVLPDWLSRVLSNTAGRASQHVKGIVLVCEG